MKIAFIGDSITKGIPKVSYFEMLKTSLKEHQLVNMGKGGDTVKSLHRRIKKKNLKAYDEFVLFVGVNDVYSKLNGVHKVFKTLRGQLWTKNLEDFKKAYQDLVRYLNSYKKRYVIIPPLVFGEDLDSKWNKELDQYETIIQDVIKEFDHIEFLEIRKQFKTVLKDKDVSNYLPYSIVGTSKDVLLDTNDKVDEVSKSRGLYVTLDGCHLNSKGASIIAEELTNYIKNR